MNPELKELVTVIMKLSHYGRARDRTIDREVRHITITDDEAIMLVNALSSVVKEQLDP